MRMAGKLSMQKHLDEVTSENVKPGINTNFIR